MKLHLSLCVLFLLVTFGKEIDGTRRGQEEYWKAVMGDERMPEAINGLLSNSHKQEKMFSENPSGGGAERLSKSSHFNREFDVSAVDAIIYHPSHHHDHDHHYYHPENPKTS